MQIKKISQELALAAVSVTIALFQIGVLSPTAVTPTAPVIVEADLQPPASADSNRKKDLNTPYVVTLDEIRAFYVQAEAGAMQGITIDEGVLHGTLTYNGREVVAGDYFSVMQLAEGLVYTPEAGFQGADHFKFQTEDLYNLGNISSFNFDIINGTVFHRESTGGGHTEDGEHPETETPETGFGGGGALTSPEPGFGGGTEGGDTEEVLEEGGETGIPNGTGAGGFPEDVEPLVRTGGVDTAREPAFSTVVALAVVCLISGLTLRIGTAK